MKCDVRYSLSGSKAFIDLSDVRSACNEEASKPELRGVFFDQHFVAYAEDEVCAVSHAHIWPAELRL